MSFKIIEDRDQAFGCSILTVQLEDGQVPTVSGMKLSRKGFDQAYLGPEDWQAQPYIFDVDATCDEDVLTVRLGPKINDLIDHDARISIDLAGSNLQGDVFWPAVPRSPNFQARSTVLEGDRQTVLRAKLADEKAPNLGQHVDTPELDNVVIEEPDENFLISDPVENPKVRSKTRFGIGAIAALLILIMAVGGWWVYSQPGLIDPNPNDNGVVPPAPVVEAKPSFGERYATLIESQDTGPQLFELYVSMRELEALDEKKRDIAYRALDASNRRGQASAALELGKLYDPRTFTPDLFFTNPDPVQALLHYRKADGAEEQNGAQLAISLCKQAASDVGPHREAYQNSRILEVCREQ